MDIPIKECTPIAFFDDSAREIDTQLYLITNETAGKNTITALPRMGQDQIIKISIKILAVGTRDVVKPIRQRKFYLFVITLNT